MERFGRCREALLSADTPEAVAKVIADCMASLPPAMIAALPDIVRNVLQRPTADISGSAVQLLRTEMTYKGQSEDAALLREIAETYALAALRLSKEGKPH